MRFVQRLTVVVTGFLVLAFGGRELRAQPKDIQLSEGNLVMQPGTSGLSGAARIQAIPGQPGPIHGPGEKPGGGPRPGRKPGEVKKPEGDNKPDGEKKDDEGKDAKKDEKDGEDKKPEGSSGPTKRPTEPPEPPDPEVLKLRPDEEGKVRFNFKGHSWPSVMEWVAEISGMSLDWQELPEGYLNLITQKRYEVADARDLVNRHLLARGYTMLIADEVISVSKIDAINPGMVPRVEPEELAERQPFEFVKVSFPLDWLLADEAVRELEPMKSPNGKLTALPATNRIEAMDAVINLRQIYEVIQEEQSDSGQDRLVREFPLKNSSADEVVEHLNTLMGIKSNGAPKGPMTREQMEAMKRQAQMQAEMAKKGVAPKAKPEVYLLADKRHNSVIANAPPDKMAVIAQAIEILDVSPVPQQSIIENVNRIQVYRLENVEPEAVVKMIEDMGSLDHTTRLEIDQENKAIIASATLVDHVTIRTLVERMDRGGRRSVIVPLTDLRAEMVVKQVDFLMGGAEEEEESQGGGGYDPFSRFRSFSRSRGSQQDGREDKFRVSADVKNNALILWCNEFELKKVEDLLDQLRAMPESEDGLFEVRVYRLNTLDPEPLVTTLEDMDALGVHASLEADAESKSIVAYATEAGHAKIQELIDRLDSSGRKFEVVQLRRLQADYVAGTIEFMMDAGEDDDQDSNRYGYYYYRGGGRQEEEKSGFKIDADVESNRLLLLANDAEMEEVMNLLVKLGEIPAEGGDPSTVRVIDSMPGPELERLLRQIEKTWPSIAPNPLLLPGKADEMEEEEHEPGPQEKSVRSGTAEKAAVAGRFRLAQLETAPKEADASMDAGPKDAGDEEAKTPVGETSGNGGETVEPTPAETSDDDRGDTAPVSITVGPDGRLVIASEDTQALDRLEELLSNLAPERPDYHIFQLKYAWAFSVALTLEDIFEDKEEETGGRGRSYYFYDYYGGGNNQEEDKLRLSSRRPLKFISDSQSNSILVQNADPGQLKLIGELIEFYDQPEPSDSQSIRKTEIVSIKYSKASVVAETVKDVYRDLLSANDKALANGQQKNAPERSYTYVYDSSDSEERKTPSFKGMLSLGVDDLSNTLVVSAPAYFITDVLKVIEDLDQAAEPTTETVEVVTLSNNVSASHLQKALANLLKSGGSGKKAQGGQPAQQPQPRPRPGPFGFPGR